MNKDRDAINTGIFSEYLQNAQRSESNTPLLVFMDELHIKNGKEESSLSRIAQSFGRNAAKTV